MRTEADSQELAGRQAQLQAYGSEEAVQRRSGAGPGDPYSPRVR